MSAQAAEKRDYYALLDVSRDATADQVREAFHRFARAHHPDNFGSVEQERAAAERMYRRGTEAYRVLMHADKRRQYDAGLAQGQLRYAPSRTQGTRTPGSGPQLRSPKARMFYNKAKKALAAEDFAQAKLNFQMALQHDPDNAELQAALDAVKARTKK